MQNVRYRNIPRRDHFSTNSRFRVPEGEAEGLSYHKTTSERFCYLLKRDGRAFDTPEIARLVSRYQNKEVLTISRSQTSLLFKYEHGSVLHALVKDCLVDPHYFRNTTPLTKTMMFGKYQIAKTFLDRGANIDETLAVTLASLHYSMKLSQGMKRASSISLHMARILCLPKATVNLPFGSH